GKAFEGASKSASDSIRDQSKGTESFLERLADTAKRIAGNIAEDFAPLAALGASTAAAAGVVYETMKRGINESIALDRTLALLQTRTGGTKSAFQGLKNSLLEFAVDGRLSINSVSNAVTGLTGSSIKNLDIIKQIAGASA